MRRRANLEEVLLGVKNDDGGVVWRRKATCLSLEETICKPPLQQRSGRGDGLL